MSGRLLLSRPSREQLIRRLRREFDCRSRQVRFAALLSGVIAAGFVAMSLWLWLTPGPFSLKRFEYYEALQSGHRMDPKLVCIEAWVRDRAFGDDFRELVGDEAEIKGIDLSLRPSYSRGDGREDFVEWTLKDGSKGQFRIPLVERRHCPNDISGWFGRRVE